MCFSTGPSVIHSVCSRPPLSSRGDPSWLKRLSGARETFGLAARRAALHVDDLAVAEREHLVALLAAAVGAEPLGGADDLVVADLGEFGLDGDAVLAAFADLEGQDLTGLVRAVSGRRALPPQVAVRDAAPLALLGDQGGEWFRVALVERCRCGAKLVDHARIMPGRR